MQTLLLLLTFVGMLTTPLSLPQHEARSLPQGMPPIVLLGEPFDLGNGTHVVNCAVAAMTSDKNESVLLRVKVKLISWRDSYVVRLTPEVVNQFRRIGISDLGKHFQGKVVQVRGKQENRMNGVLGVDFTLNVTDIGQFEAVEPAGK